MIQDFLLFFFILCLVCIGAGVTVSSGLKTAVFEGSMVAGLCVSVFLLKTAAVPQWLVIILCLAAACLSGVLISLLAWLLLRNAKTPLMASFGINMLITYAAVILVRYVNVLERGAAYHFITLPEKDLFWVRIASVEVNLFLPLAFVFILGTLALLYSRTGMRIRAVGDDASAASLSGIRVQRTRLSAVLLSGALSGMAGLGMCLVSTAWNFRYGALGMGYIALLCALIAKGRPGGWIGFAVLFSVLFAIGFSPNLGALRSALAVREAMLQALPYAVFFLFSVLYSRQRYTESIPEGASHI